MLMLYSIWTHTLQLHVEHKPDQFMYASFIKYWLGKALGFLARRLPSETHASFYFLFHEPSSHSQSTSFASVNSLALFLATFCSSYMLCNPQSSPWKSCFSLGMPLIKAKYFFIYIIFSVSKNRYHSIAIPIFHPLFYIFWWRNYIAILFSWI